MGASVHLQRGKPSVAGQAQMNLEPDWLQKTPPVLIKRTCKRSVQRLKIQVPTLVTMRVKL